MRHWRSRTPSLRDRLEHLVQTDQLTELYSRTYLDEKIQYSMKIHKRGVFILVDIDNFKILMIHTVIKREIRS